MIQTKIKEMKEMEKRNQRETRNPNRYNKTLLNDAERDLVDPLRDRRVTMAYSKSRFHHIQV